MPCDLPFFPTNLPADIAADEPEVRVYYDLDSRGYGCWMWCEVEGVERTVTEAEINRAMRDRAFREDMEALAIEDDAGRRESARADAEERRNEESKEGIERPSRAVRGPRKSKTPAFA